MNKPPVLSKEGIIEGIAAKLFYQKFPPNNDALAYNFRWEDIPFDGCPSGEPFRRQAKAVYDFVELAIQQAKEEIFEEIEAEVFDVNDETRRLNLMVINENAAYEWWQSLESKHLKG